MTQTPDTYLNPFPHPEPSRDERLDYLFAEFTRLKPLFDNIKNQFDTVKDAIKYEATTAHPGEPKIRLEHPNLRRPIEVGYTERENWNSKAFKREHPEMWEEYKKPPTSVWTLKEVNGS